MIALAFFARDIFRGPGFSRLLRNEPSNDLHAASLRAIVILINYVVVTVTTVISFWLQSSLKLSRTLRLLGIKLDNGSLSSEMCPFSGTGISTPQNNTKGDRRPRRRSRSGENMFSFIFLLNEWDERLEGEWVRAREKKMFFRENFSFIYLHRRLFLLDSHSASAPFTEKHRLRAFGVAGTLRTDNGAWLRVCAWAGEKGWMEMRLTLVFPRSTLYVKPPTQLHSMNIPSRLGNYYGISFSSKKLKERLFVRIVNFTSQPSTTTTASERRRQR